MWKRPYTPWRNPVAVIAAMEIDSKNQLVPLREVVV